MQKDIKDNTKHISIHVMNQEEHIISYSSEFSKNFCGFMSLMGQEFLKIVGHTTQYSKNGIPRTFMFLLSGYFSILGIVFVDYEVHPTVELECD